MLEDLHDADPHSLAVLDYLLDNIAGSPVALLGALRDQPSDAWDLLVAANDATRQNYCRSAHWTGRAPT